jgi:cytochrome c
MCVNPAADPGDTRPAQRRTLIDTDQQLREAIVMTRTTALRAGLWAGIASLGLATAPVSALDADAAQALAKKSNCTKCHSVSAKKEGPPYKETAAKYKGKADAEQKLFTHLTTSPKVKVDGKEEEHTAVKSKDEAEIKNLIAYILAQ